MDLQELFDEHAGIALSRQRDLTELIGTHAWDFDMTAGTMTFTKGGFLGFGEERRVSAVQVLGSESEHGGTWLWAWANEASGIPGSMLTAAERLRALGEEHRIPELTEPQLPLDRWDGHQLCMVATGLLDTPGYYRGPYDGGAVLVLLTNEAFRTAVESPMVRYSTVLPELLGDFEVRDQRRAARGLAAGLSLQVSGDDDLTVSGPEGNLTLEFDEHARMTSMQGKLQAPD